MRPFENRAYPSSITQIADELQSKGIKTIEGDIVIDDTYFLHQPFGLAWTIEDTAWSYGAPVSALVINENMIAVRILPGEHYQRFGPVPDVPCGNVFENGYEPCKNYCPSAEYKGELDP